MKLNLTKEAIEHKMQGNMNDHFSTPLTEEDLQKMIEDKVPSSTKEKEKWAMKLFDEWLENRNSHGIINGLHEFRETCDGLNLNGLP